MPSIYSRRFLFDLYISKSIKHAVQLIDCESIIRIFFTNRLQYLPIRIHYTEIGTLLYTYLVSLVYLYCEQGTPAYIYVYYIHFFLKISFKFVSIVLTFAIR